jgi:hypothetical protein
MPTNILRDARGRRAASAPARATTAPALTARHVRLVAGRVALRLTLLATPTADRLWQALPLFSTVETWGDSIHFELPLESGRDRTARLNGIAGEVYYWADDDRVVVPWGPTPISKPGEVRLMRPCNVFAVTMDDVGALAAVTPGERLSLHRVSGSRRLGALGDP